LAEEQHAAAMPQVTRDEDYRSRLSYWFPRLQAAGLPVPRTVIVPLAEGEERDLWHLADGEESWALAAVCARLRDACRTPFGLDRCFLRTDFLSGKHGWKDTCCVLDLARLEHHVARLFEFSAMADFFGFPFDVLVVRELLPTAPVFTAFWGRMPITREFRCFVNHGVVVHRQPYWPPDSIAGYSPSADDWRRRLARISALTDAERLEIGLLAMRAWKAVGDGGYWSVDVLEVPGCGWMVTDMAEGEKSFRWEGV
jgi:hypothetical protein